MNRREALKGLAALGLLSIIPRSLLHANSTNIPIHIIGLGGAGCNALELIYKKGIKATYTCISSPVRHYLPNEIKFIYFESPEMIYAVNSGMKIHLPDEIKNIFIKANQYLLLTGLGGYAGSSLIKPIIDKLIQEQKKFNAICSLPFNFEGPMRKSISEQVVLEYKHLNNFRYFESEMFRNDLTCKSVADAFRKVDEQFYSIYTKNLA
jgi:cell division GTPase FtsZ